MTWNGTVLAGRSTVVANDEYVVVLREPAGFRFRDADASGAVAAAAARPDGLRELRLRADVTGPVTWRVRYTPAPP